MSVVHPRAHATTNMTEVKGGRGKEIILKIHYTQNSSETSLLHLACLD